MFSIFGKNKALTITDIHSHLVPSIDDGATSIDNSIELIRELYLLGYRRLIVTPHVSDMFKNTKKEILEAYSLLTEKLDKEGIAIKLEIGAEYYIDEDFMELLETQKLLSFGKENYLLFEFSYFTPPRDVEDLIYEIILKGYTPILAHPERYTYWHGDISEYKNLKEMEVLFQLNLNSLNNYYCPEIKKCAKELIKNSYIDFVGTDTHHMQHIKNLKKVFSLSLYRKIFKYNNILNDVIYDPNY